MVDESLLSRLLVGLPREPNAAILTFARNILSAIEQIRTFDQRDSVAIYSFMTRFIQKYDIVVKIQEKRIMEISSDDVVVAANRIVRSEILLSEASILEDVENAMSRVALDIDQESFGIATLNANEKQKIQEHIRKIRLLIHESDLDIRKKNALLDRLNALSSEVDQYGTRTDRFFAFMGDIAFVAGDMAKKAKPLVDEVKDMMKIISRSRARQEGVSLPPGDEAILLPPPENVRAEDV
ncbi:hypothetical protein [Methylosinus sp. LW4]|uniref:hypothetical protein n=1 Tax=Methylosinus sp. LW4 TaxID=136993 RepID=UPI0012F8082D|nr:hypothetical protein [Methylosinus sp. LW4]